MKHKISIIPIFLLGSIFLQACMTIGVAFKHENVPELKLGVLKSSEYRSLFGKPYRIYTETNDYGYYEKAMYHFSRFNVMDKYEQRVLYLEFKDGVLNAYDYLSSFDKDKTKANLENVQKIERKRSTKADVIRILGEPTGKALCPTVLYGIKDKCEPDGEIWAWRSKDNSIHEKAAGIFVVFNKDSVVIEIHTSTTQPE